MDRSWMYSAPRASQTFVNGVQAFLNFAFERACISGGRITCPCIKCLNMLYKSRQTVLDHLICFGFRPEYFKWVYHGEGTLAASTSTPGNPDDFTNDDNVKVKGPEKRGYIQSVRNCVYSLDLEIHQLKTVVDVLINVIQEHIPNADMSPVLSIMNKQVPGSCSAVPNSLESVNEMSSSRSHNNNGKKRRLAD